MSNRETSSSESDRTIRSQPNTTFINPGPPALYQLNTERTSIEGTDRKVRRWTYGQRVRSKKNKVILLVGETGSGKTTLINTIINYSLGVKFEDQEFYQITEEPEEQQSQSQTSEVTVYEVFIEENPTSLTIIDTPGYAHTKEHEKDREVSEYLLSLFSVKDGVHHIDSVCFVMKASQNRLFNKEHYIFHSVLSLFGRDIEEIIVFLLTHSDGGPPTDALNAINTAEIPCRRDEDGEPVHFIFNNRQKEKRVDRYKHTFRSSWEMCERSMNEFFTLLDEKSRKSVQMTVDVLKERRRLEACVSNLKERINEKELKTEELTQIQEAVTHNREKIQKCENFEFTVNKVYKDKVAIVNEWKWNNYATCCSVCEENCHEWNCYCALDPSWCWVMENNHCTVCTGKCHHSKHIRENKKYVMKTKEVRMTFDELRQEYESSSDRPETSFDKEKYDDTKVQYESNMREFEHKTQLENQLMDKLEKIKSEKSKLVDEAYMTITKLSKISLKSDSALTLQHLDFLIPRLIEERRDEWARNLEDLRRSGEEWKNKGALQYVVKI